jgi:hypothetical protein
LPSVGVIKPKEEYNKVKKKDQVGPNAWLCGSKVEQNIEAQSITIVNRQN